MNGKVQTIPKGGGAGAQGGVKFRLPPKSYWYTPYLLGKVA